VEQIVGIYEIAIQVKDLEQAEGFYCNTLGLASGLRQDDRRWHFLWVGGRSGMVVLQEDTGEWPLQHFAFSVSPAALDAACASAGAASPTR
jgi:catechol 2,3-dioxygenase-like lactoylglutathione lyase family enzyme